MTIDEIKELIHVVRETRYCGDGSAARATTRADQDAQRTGPGHAACTLSDSGPIVRQPRSPPAASSPPPLPCGRPLRRQTNDHKTVVKSPIVGTYYDSPHPAIRHL